MVIVRLATSAFLIWRVALGETWALVVILVLMTISHEGVVLLIKPLKSWRDLDRLLRRVDRERAKR